jgi:hypothetical protein
MEKIEADELFLVYFPDKNVLKTVKFAARFTGDDLR